MGKKHCNFVNYCDWKFAKVFVVIRPTAEIKRAHALKSKRKHKYWLIKKLIINESHKIFILTREVE